MSKRRTKGEAVVERGDSGDVRRRKFLVYYQNLARERGGACLSTVYVSAHAKLHFRCALGHEWEAAGNSVRQGRWCPECARSHRHDGNKARAFAKALRTARWRGGRCLSDVYVNAHTHLPWECAEGHRWKAVAASINQGSWCPKCAGKGLTIEDMHATAATRGGRCLSTVYVNDRTPLRWACAVGHEWMARPDNIRQGRWCPRCAHSHPLSLEEMQTTARERGGECLSRRYVNIATKMRFRCAVGHVFRATPNFVRSGGWCPKCRGVARGTLARVQAVARRRNGECLATEYVDSMTLMPFRCSEGHEWEAPANRIIQGTWCRACADEARRGRPLRRYSIVDMQELASSRGGACTSQIYSGSDVKLGWRCFSGHEWEAKPPQVRHRSWCPVCARRWRGTIDGMRALAVDRGGRCHSNRYDGHQTKLDFECAAGHRFVLTGRAAKTGVWCSKCRPVSANPSRNRVPGPPPARPGLTTRRDLSPKAE